jgi:hypothetical protein
VCIRDCAFNCDVRRTTDGGKGGAKEDRVVVNADTSRLVAKGGDGGEDVGPSGRSIGLELNEDGDDGSCCVTDCAKDIAVTGSVGGRGGTPDVQSQSVKGMRGITVTGRATVDRGNGGLGSSAVRAER